MVALVTGGAGFVGSHLVDGLLTAGHDVRVLDDLSTGSLDNLSAVEDDVDVVIGSAIEPATVDRAMQDVDLVFHLAATVGVELVARDPASSLWSNIAGTRNVVDAARRQSARLVFTSSSEVYGASTHFPQCETADRLLGPTSELRWGYAESKAVGEQLVLANAIHHDLRATVVRLFNVVGPRQSGAHGMVLPRFVRWALEGAPIEVYGDGSQTRTFCAIGDIVPALVAVAECDEATGRVVNLGSSTEISMLDLARTVCRVVGSSSPIRLVPLDAVPGRSVDFQRRVPDTSLATELIGFRPTIGLDAVIKAIAAELGP